MILWPLLRVYPARAYTTLVVLVSNLSLVILKKNSLKKLIYLVLITNGIFTFYSSDASDASPYVFLSRIK